MTPTHKITFTIPGDPIGKERPRFTRGSKVMTYTPRKTHAYEDSVRYLGVMTRKKEGISTPIDKFCGVSIKAYYKVPKSFSKKRRQLCLDGLERPTKKPDGDNIAKIILDGMNPKQKLNRRLHKYVTLHEGMYLDDSQVVDHRVQKFYSKNPRVEVTVFW